MKSIRSKIIIVSCLICIFSILSATIISYKILSTNIKEQTLGKLEETSKKYASEIDGWFAVQGKILNEIYNEIIYNNDFDKERLIAYFNYKNKTNPDINEYYIAFSDNIFVTGDGLWIPESDYNCVEKEWYRKADESNEVVVSSPYVDSNHGNVIVTVSKAIRINGTTIGVLCSDISIDHIVNIINEAKPSEESYGFLIDNNGNILAHPKKEYLYSKERGLVNIYDAYKVADINTGVASLKEIETVLDYDGIEKYFLYTNLEFMGWNVGFSVPVKEVLEPLKKIVNSSIVLAIILTFISVGLTFILGNSFSKPIKRATYYIEQMAELDIRQDIDERNLKRKDEIGRMFRSFQLIVESLREFLINLRIISDKISTFSGELASSSHKSSIDADNVAETSASIAEISDSQLKKITKIIDSIKGISYKINELIDNGVIEDNQVLSQLKSIGIEIEDLIKESNNTKYIKIFEADQMKNVTSLTEKQTLLMEQISSASDCLAELGQELNEYIDNFKS
jgi:methyl-accepting chemotaxis protein